MEPSTTLAVVAYTAPITIGLLSIIDGWSAGSSSYSLAVRRSVQWVTLLLIFLSWVLLQKSYPDGEFPATDFLYIYLFSVWVSVIIRPVFFIISYKVTERKKPSVVPDTDQT